MTTPRINARLAIACLAAASTGLSVAIISISKVLLLITSLGVLLRDRQVAVAGGALQKMWTLRLVLVIVFVFAASLLWTSAPMSQALVALGKYGKLLIIPALLVLIRTYREATWVVLAFLGAQAFLLVSSWLLYLHLPVFWATSRTAQTSYAVFSSYLDQGIMSAVVAGIFWHLRALAPSRPLAYVCVLMSILALGNVFIVFTGRTGHLVGIGMMSLAIFWALPRRYRFGSLLLPPLLFLLIFFSSDKVAQRFLDIKTNVSAYSAGIGASTAADNRLDFWVGSLKAISEKPFVGTGIGSWATEYDKIQGLKNSALKNSGIGSGKKYGNPHQEFLLWAVQLGVGGIVLLLAFLGAALFDLLKMATPVARAGQSVLAAWMVSCLFNSSIYDAYIGDFFCLSLGVLLVYGLRSRDVPVGGNRQPWT